MKFCRTPKARGEGMNRAEFLISVGKRILVLFSLCGILLVHSVIGVTVGRYANSFDAGSFNLSIKKNTYTVTYYDYKATANEEEIILKIDTVEIGTTYTVNYTYNGDIPDGNTFKCWTNAGGTQFNNGDTIPVTNTSDVVLRPSFNKLFTITFVQQDGTIIKTQTFTNTTDKSSITTPTPDAINQMEFDQWVVRNDDGKFQSFAFCAHCSYRERGLLFCQPNHLAFRE